MPAPRWHALPAAVHALVDRSPGTVLLEGAGATNSAWEEEPWTRLFTAPLHVIAACSAAEMPALFAEIETAVAAGRSAAGFFSYECGICFEPKANMRPPRPGIPLAWFGIYEHEFLFDHESGNFAGAAPPGLNAAQNGPVAGHDLPGSPATGLDRWGGLSRAESSSRKEEGLSPRGNTSPSAADSEVAAQFSIAEADYFRRIAAIHESIRAGDVYQINFTAPLRLSASGSAASLYARLRNRQPARYGAYLHWQTGRRILSFSPELFFRIDNAGPARRIVTRPMKGTAPRGRTAREDRDSAEWLRNDPKNRAENLMIVDLVRNDLGRLARFGTVHAENLFAVERLPTLWQMTSTVSAELRDEIGLEAVFRALFPCGSITGAPKVRAMQLIAELEGQPRGVYTGAIGFFSPRQAVFNVAIRTLELESEGEGNRGVMGLGGGIVIDSDPAAEYRECLLKAEFLTREKQRPEFSLIETMLWDNGFPLLGLHLDRLADSAEYFDFPCDRAAIEAALESHAQKFVQGAPHRVRLLLDSSGQTQITDEPLASTPSELGKDDCHPERSGPQWNDCHPERRSPQRPESKDLLLSLAASAPPVRVRISPQRTDPADPMLFHKTTYRPLYAPAFEAAARDGFADALFFNLRGELTEGAIGNVFIEKDGRWFTPPIDCGLLAGVYRRHLLEMHPEIEERILYEQDLRTADAIYLCNAVRGLRRAEIEWPTQL